MIISLQGSMAVGKTTILRKLEKEFPEFFVSYEDNADVVAELKKLKLEKNNFEDYVKIQKLWIENEITRYNNVKNKDKVIMDFGAEEIEFHTLAFPKTKGYEWDVEGALKEELSNLRKILPHKILFLQATEDVLRKRKENDSTRSRNSFEVYLKEFLPLKLEWFKNKNNVEFLNTDNLSIDEVYDKVALWLKKEFAC